MSETCLATIISIISIALAACSSPTPDAFNRPITPTSGTADSNDTSGDGTGASAADPSTDTSPSTSTKTGSSSTSTTSTKACLPAVASPGTGEHHPGESCAQCHDSMPNAAWTVSGTVFGSGGVGVAGATIEVVDASGKKLLLVTGDNGNFYSSSAVQMPLTVRSSKCPSDSAMAAKVNAGSCNSCHSSTNPITL